MEKKSSYKELEQKLIDKELFIEIFPLFQKMSERGKVATIETLSYIKDLDIVIRKRRNKQC